MFDKKNKSTRKSAHSSIDRATITVVAPSVSDQQRQQIEQNLASFDPTWDGGECHLSVPLDATTQEQLGQLVSMFPNSDVRLETTSGDNIIMSRAGSYKQHATSYGTSPESYSTKQDDTDKLPQG